LSERSEHGDGAAQPSEQEYRLRLATLHSGAHMAIVGSVGLGAYALATPSGPHRALIAGLAAVGVVAGSLQRFLPSCSWSFGRCSRSA
jgi:hypothetical protein